ncbi:MAG: flagellar hook-basal body complex protein FliE [Lachnospiraceae bacterium]|nr:flagellar hook-basal body complex protein FliE [Lachnospiraceae bacterium]
MNISNINSVSLVEAFNNNLPKLTSPNVDHSAFDLLLSAAKNNLNTTNAYQQNAQNEEIKWALGESASTHDLTTALQKSSIALQYTVAVRDKVLEAYKEVMQMQI